MIKKNVTEARAQLSSLLESVENGEVVVISRGSKPIAKLVPFIPDKIQRAPGRLRGKIRISPDFDSLNPEIAEMFGLK